MDFVTKRYSSSREAKQDAAIIRCYFDERNARQFSRKTEQIKLKQKRYRISFDGCLKCKQDTSEGNTAHLRAICFA